MQYLILILLLLGNSQRTFAASSAVEIVYNDTEEKDKAGRIKALVKEAKKLKGTKYKYGGQSVAGMDCSGFIQYVFQQVDLSLPRSTSLQLAKGKKVKIKDSKQGDLLFFKSNGKVTHVAMVVHHTKNQFVIVHSTSSKGVIFEDLNSSAYWKNKVFVAKRLI